MTLAEQCAKKGTGPISCGPPRRGFTLVELLVVVSIIVMLTAFALPVITPSVESRRIREAARAVNVYLGSARNRAMETGRPCGVIFQRSPGLNQATVTLFQAQVPPPYAGEEINSKVRMRILQSSPATGYFVCQATPVGGFTSQLVLPGDLMQVNGQGPLYEIINPASLTLKVTLPRGGNLPWPPSGTQSLPVSYKIFRRPEVSMVAPLQLPSTVAVDLRWSGGSGSVLAADAFQPAGDGDTTFVAVMFSPRGDVDRVWLSSGDKVLSEPLYFLIGKQERVPATVNGPSPAEDGLHNWRDPSNLWVTLNPQTGLIKTTEVRAGGDLRESRQIAQSEQSMGGK